jgi:cephalosporin-C deacetylase-like acetyl esterase
MSSILYRVKSTQEFGEYWTPSIRGRHGTFDVAEVEINHWGAGAVDIDAIGKRGSIITGGLTVTPEMMDELAAKWIEYRGYGNRKEQEHAG